MSEQRKNQRSSLHLIIASAITFTVTMGLIEMIREKFGIAAFNIFNEGIFNLRFILSTVFYFAIFIAIFLVVDWLLT